MGNYYFQLEPDQLIQAFLDEAPEDFVSLTLDLQNQKIPAFLANFDVLLTAEDSVKRNIEIFTRCLPTRWVNKYLRPRTLFVGTTVSEYVLLPSNLDPEMLGELLLAKMRELRINVVVIKDIPSFCPLISNVERDKIYPLRNAMQRLGFALVEGHSLAYTPVNFASIEEYFDRFSGVHRKDLKRKLKKRDQVTLAVWKTGDPYFASEENVFYFYQLYLNVYEHSCVHFEKLTLNFFRRILRDKSALGLLWVYSRAGRIIGFQLSYTHQDVFIDQYIGFLYPESRESNLYFLSWFDTLEYCIRNGMKYIVHGWAHPEIKAYLGAEFTFTTHAVYINNPILLALFRRFSGLFKADERHLLHSVALRDP